MSGFSPVVIGPSPELRAEVEDFFSTDSAAVAEQFAGMEQRISRLGLVATFGMETELLFVPDPAVRRPPNARIRSSEELYEETIEQIVDTSPNGQENHIWPKGKIIPPADNQGPVMLNQYLKGTYNPDYAQQGIIEIRSAPAGANEAANRYWNTMEAFGSVAEGRGYMSVVLATHISMAAASLYSGEFVRFYSSRGSRLLAAMQHNLNVIHPLQTHAGLQSGTVVLEAYPYKSAPTAIHEKRLELRHPSIGIVDPRIDMFAGLDAVERFASNTVTSTEMQTLHKCSSPELTFQTEHMLGAFTRAIETGAVLWDHNARKFVLPTLLHDSSGTWDVFDVLTEWLTDGKEFSTVDDNGRAVRKALGTISISEGKIRTRRSFKTSVLGQSSIYAHKINETEVSLQEDKPRVIPIVFVDSPESHQERRARVSRSPHIRRMLGPVLSTLTPAAQAIEERDRFVSNRTVTETD